MTQTLSKVATRLPRPLESAASYIVLERPEPERLLSAYNKKVLASVFDIKKRALLQATGLRYGMTFPEFIHTLSWRCRAKKFVDRHFVPQEYLHQKIDRSKPWQRKDITSDGKRFVADFPRTRSSAQLRYLNGMKHDLSEEDLRLVEEYQSIWRR